MRDTALTVCSVRLRRVATAGMFLLMLSGGFVDAAPAKIEESTSATTVRVAEPFTIEWTVTAAADAKVSFPAIGEQLGEFEVSEVKDWFDVPEHGNGGQRTWTRRLSLESISTGELVVPSIEIRINEQGVTQTIQSKPIQVMVRSVLEGRGDPTKFRDIQSVWDVEVPKSGSSTWGWWVGLASTGLVLLAIAGVAVSRRGRWLTPKQWALEELDWLAVSLKTKTTDIDMATLKLPEILSRFLLIEYGISEAGHTAHEILRAIDAERALGSDISSRLKALFDRSDSAKFAGHELTRAELENAVDQSRALVLEIAQVCESVDDNSRIRGAQT